MSDEDMRRAIKAKGELVDLLEAWQKKHGLSYYEYLGYILGVLGRESDIAASLERQDRKGRRDMMSGGGEICSS